MILRALANSLLSTLFEPPCAACGQVLSHPLGGAVCDRCWTSIAAGASLFERPHGGHAVDWSCAVDHYEGRLRDVIHALKYERRRSIAKPLGVLMRDRGWEVLHDVEVAVPVPLHPRRHRTRGFNQADDLAQQLDLRVVPLLQRVRHTPSQIDLPADQRHQNVRDAFALIPDPRSPIPGVVVLIDDVSTTGATLEACAKVLKQSGVREVRALTAARVVTGRR